MQRRGFASVRAAVLAVALGVVLVAALVAQVGATRLAPGEPIITAAEGARSVVVGVVDNSRQLDGRAYTAYLRVSLVLRGTVRADVDGGAPQLIAWEQPVGRAEPQLSNGQRVLVALYPVPNNTWWQQRAVGIDALLIGGGGHAYVVDPGDSAIAHLTTYLGLAPEQRQSDIGVLLLSRLVRDGQPVVGAAALRRVAEIPAGPNPEAVKVLARAAVDARVDRELRVAIIAMIRERRLFVARSALDELAAPPSDLEPEALDAIAALDGELAVATVERLLVHPSARYRLVGARHARGALAERYLARLATTDPDPRVRAAAASSLAATQTTWGLAAAIDALADPIGEVRSVAAQAIARLGATALPALQAEIDAGSPSAQGAIATLAVMGAVGNRALVAVALAHPNEQMRGFALLALGRVRDEH